MASQTTVLETTTPLEKSSLRRLLPETIPSATGEWAASIAVPVPRLNNERIGTVPPEEQHLIVAEPLSSSVKPDPFPRAFTSATSGAASRPNGYRSISWPSYLRASCSAAPFQVGL
jgi:hypothetical protein